MQKIHTIEETVKEIRTHDRRKQGRERTHDREESKGEREHI